MAGITCNTHKPLKAPGTNRNRRAVLAKLAALPLSTAAVASGRHPDAVLLAFGTHFDAAVAAHKAHAPAYFAADEAHTQTLHNAKAAGRFKGLDAEAYSEFHSRLIEPFNAVYEKDTALHDACGRLGEQIIAIQPRTLAGIAVIARVCQFESRQAWEAPKSREYDEDVLVALVDSILAVAATA